MGLLSRKKPDEQDEASRQLIISYKKFFGSSEGKDVLFDLMNKFHVLNTHQGDVFNEGERAVVLYILNRSNVDLVQYDKILKGEFNV